MNALETPAIQKTPGVCGGQARVRDTRIPVWILVLNRKCGEPDASVLRSYPTLTQTDLDAAWDYYQHNPVEIEQSIWLNDVAGNVPDGAPVPTGVIIAGRLLGLDDDAIREAFEPPLTPEQISAAWAEYRAEPVRIGRSLAPLRPAG
jgi:uncharacterized protein (DUF433 family)